MLETSSSAMAETARRMLQWVIWG